MKHNRLVFFIFALILSVFVFSGPVFASSFSFAFGGTFPPGNYQDTCNNCFLMGNELACSCQTENGAWVNSSLKITHHCRSVVNTNGQLQCIRHHHRHHHRHWHHHHHWHHRHRRRYAEINAGPIWNNEDANQTCPAVCANYDARWTGQWNTIEEGMQSVCQCKRR